MGEYADIRITNISKERGMIYKDSGYHSEMAVDKKSDRIKQLTEERDALKIALEGLCNTGYSQPSSKAWEAAREALKGKS